MKQLAWVRAIMDHRKWTQTELARASGVHPSTLSRFLREAHLGSNLNSRIVAQIAQATGFKAYDLDPPQPVRGFAEDEAKPFAFSEADRLTAIIDVYRQGRNGIETWIMQSRGLELAGYLPGDVLIVDMNRAPKPGDAVCVQLIDRSGEPETAFRLYEPPFLVAASVENALRRPVLVDNERAQIRGVVIASIRHTPDTGEEAAAAAA